MKNIIIITILLIMQNLLIYAQVLDHNNSSARINNNGVLFNNQSSQTADYKVPKNDGINAIFATSLWCSGLDGGGQLNTAAMRYGQAGGDFFAGPYSNSNSYTNSAYISAYGNSIWQVTRAEVQYHILSYANVGYVMPISIATWPGNGIQGVGVDQNLAPFVDLNGNGIYEPILGDYPDIRGDKAVYTIMNDAKGPHLETGGQPMNIEVHTMAYQYSTNDYRDNSTFLHYRVFNRGTAIFGEFKLGIWWDPDLGNSLDDFIGCDTLTNMMYVYNGDNFDENSGANLGYQMNPPAIGLSCLNKKMDYFSCFNGGSSYPYTDPTIAPEYYNFMNGRWSNAELMYYGGTGVIGSPGSSLNPTRYLYHGNPNNASEWSEVSNGNISGDRRGVMTIEAESLPSGAHECYDFVVIYSRLAGNNSMQNVNSLIAIANEAKTDFDQMTTYNCDLYTLNLEELSFDEVGLFPNPSNGEFTLAFESSLSGEIQIVDVTGRIVYNKRFANKSSLEVQLNEKPGLYLVSIHTVFGAVRKKLTIEGVNK